MRKKKTSMTVCALLTLSLVLSGCGNKTFSDLSVNVPQVTSESAASVTEPIQLEYEYVRALLKDNQLQITILSNESADRQIGDYGNIRYDVPYSVSGLKGIYTDMIIGTVGQDIWPYVFLLTDKATVECVPVADQIYGFENSSGSSADVSFKSIGVLQGVSNVVSFREGSVTDESGGGYTTVFAESADGASYDLSNPIYFIDEPEEAPASEKDSLRMLTKNAEVSQLIAQGKKLWNTGEINYLYGEYCSLFSLGADHKQQLSRQWLYGVGASGAVYSCNDASEECHPVNHLAEVYSAADSYSDLFVIVSDPDDPVYQECKDAAELISTPVVDLDASKPVLLLPLKAKMNLKVEMMADNSGDYNADVEDTFFDGTVSRKTPYLIGVTLSETSSVLRVTAVWNDGLDDITAVWYAVYNGGSKLYTQYVAGEYLPIAD